MIYAALLKGINVGGQKRIKMADLVTVCEELNFINITTYLQSGNIIFEYEADDSELLEDKIKIAILEKYGFEVDSIIRTADELEKIVSGNPLAEKPGIDVEKLHVTFLQYRPEKAILESLKMNREENEIYEIKNREIYLYCPNGYGVTKLSNQAFEKKLKTIATTRNWNSVLAILKIAEDKRR